jgi:serine/threonine protein kinase
MPPKDNNNIHLSVNTYLQGGKYRIVRYIKSGGFGCTYEAEHVLLGKHVAIKEFFVKDFCNRDKSTRHVTIGTESKRGLVTKLRKKFVAEAKAICLLNHPNIVSVSDIFEENGTAYYVMDYIDGESLSDIVNKEGPLPERRALKYIREVCDALAYVHKKNILHLDIKPGNIMIDKRDHAILIDFGASKQYDECDGENTSTLTGKTPGYAPLEQMGNDVVKFLPATDIYSIGATLYKLLTGKTPLSATMLAAGDTLEPLPANISSSTRKAISAAMELIKNKRPQSIEEFLKILDSGKSEENDEDTIPVEIFQERNANENNNKPQNNKPINAIQLNNMGVSAFEEGRIEEAISYFFSAANKGLSDAMYNLGLMYDKKQIYDQAIYWYKTAAQKGLSNAMYNVGECYENGKGVPQNYELALSWYRKAADKGNKDALDSINRLKQTIKIKNKADYKELLNFFLYTAATILCIWLLVWFFDRGGGYIKGGAFILPIITTINAFKSLFKFFKSLK